MNIQNFSFFITWWGHKQNILRPFLSAGLLINWNRIVSGEVFSSWKNIIVSHSSWLYQFMGVICGSFVQVKCSGVVSCHILMSKDCNSDPIFYMSVFTCHIMLNLPHYSSHCWCWTVLSCSYTCSGWRPELGFSSSSSSISAIMGSAAVGGCAGQQLQSSGATAGHPSVMMLKLRVGGACGVMPRPLTFH